MQEVLHGAVPTYVDPARLYLDTLPSLKPSEQMSFLEDQTGITVVHEERQDIDNSTLSVVLIDWRENYKYTIDGVIVTNDQVYSRTSKNPEHGFAFKMVLSDQVAEAKVIDVLWLFYVAGN